MKKIYLSILVIACTINANAQLSLTKAFNEPVLGDVNSKEIFDSTAVLPNGSGTGQVWDFSGLTASGTLDVVTFTTVASTPSASAFPSATLADSDGAGAYTYYKPTATQYEMVGLVDPIIALSFSNTAVIAIWPVTMGYTNTDVFAGTANSSFAGSGTATGTITTSATGTGTLIAPGGAVFTNVLKVQANQKVDVSLSFGAFTATLTTIDYNYYHASQKFPLLTVTYSDITGSFPSTSATIKANSLILTGINDVNFDASFSMFPNPAKNNFNVKLHNQTNAVCNIEIMNAIGQTAKVINLGNETEIEGNVSISDLSAGIYFVKTSLGNKISVKKLIVE
ncbi:MAG: T9SS type A sorting domain-containing protein [Bacteroidota bacterium]